MIAISVTGRLLRRLVRLSCWRPGLTVAVSLLLAAAGLAWTFHALAFKTSGRDLLPQDTPYGELEGVECARHAQSRQISHQRPEPRVAPQVGRDASRIGAQIE